MKASVVIPTKNAGGRFHQVLNAVMEQKTPWPYEVLVIDSGSSDGTVEFVKSMSGVHLHQIPPSEFGHGKTRNLGVSLTTGEFVVMLTHDALPANESWLYELVKAVEQDDDIAGAFGRHLAYPQDGPFLERDLQLHFDSFLRWPAIVYLHDKERYRNDQGYRQMLHFFSDNNACIRRSVWEKIPYPEVDFAEDQLWAKEIIEAGYKKAYADKAIVYHSHSFGFIELGRRCFDEARAMQRLFGYQLCPTLFHLLAQSVRTTANDVKYLRSKKKLWSEKEWLFRSPFRNVAKQAGYYLGQRADHLPEWLVRCISRDMALQRR
ncbi:MAG: glycosyltransferase family 2 protein [Methanobacteriota archaeon]|nr:MAG: glycosyltransferase family 2 protein [Euryarchaeota archaeon]